MGYKGDSKEYSFYEDTDGRKRRREWTEDIPWTRELHGGQSLVVFVSLRRYQFGIDIPKVVGFISGFSDLPP